jgi:hypothetical protein
MSKRDHHFRDSQERRAIALIDNDLLTLQSKQDGGWQGYSRIKLLPSDFVGGAAANPEEITTANNGGRVAAGATPLIATVSIPSGFRATKVIVYGDSEADTIDVYECQIDDVTATSKGSGFVEAGVGDTTNELNLTATVTATEKNYLSIKVTGDVVYGGYVTIEEV